MGEESVTHTFPDESDGGTPVGLPTGMLHNQRGSIGRGLLACNEKVLLHIVSLKVSRVM